MYKESTSPSFRNLSPRDAETYLALNNFPGQRKYNAIKGRHYADNMENGTHRRIDIAIVKVRATDTRYLMNGQHNCQALLIYGKPHPAVVSHYICDTMEGAWRLFTTFDVHATRSEQQFMKSRRGMFVDERLHDIPLRTLGSCGAALYMLGNGVEPKFIYKTIRAKTDKSDCVEQFSDDVVFVNRYSHQKHMLNVGTVTAIIATRRRNEAKAIEFWDKVATGEMLRAGDHRYRLRDQLISGAYLSELRGGTQRQRANYALCVAWWNSWRAGDSRRSVKINSMASLPKVSG